MMFLCSVKTKTNYEHKLGLTIDPEYCMCEDLINNYQNSLLPPFFGIFQDVPFFQFLDFFSNGYFAHVRGKNSLAKNFSATTC